MTTGARGGAFWPAFTRSNRSGCGPARLVLPGKPKSRRPAAIEEHAGGDEAAQGAPWQAGGSFAGPSGPARRQSARRPRGGHGRSSTRLNAAGVIRDVSPAASGPRFKRRRRNASRAAGSVAASRASRSMPSCSPVAGFAARHVALRVGAASGSAANTWRRTPGAEVRMPYPHRSSGRQSRAVAPQRSGRGRRRTAGRRRRSFGGVCPCLPAAKPQSSALG